MDFVTQLPRSQGKNAILVVVDRLSKYAHFCPLSPGFTAETVATCFIREICRLHGVPTTIVSDRDPIFMSQFWKELFRRQGTTLAHSSAYHPQSDGQNEVLNRILEDYLRCYVNDAQTNWVALLPWAELQYNTSWHSGTLTTPFEAFYGQAPPTLLDYEPGASNVAAVDSCLSDRTHLLKSLRSNLANAQRRMTHQANKRRRNVVFEVGDWVLLRLQPYRQTTLSSCRSPKLEKRFYGPFRVREKIGQVAYRLELPAGARIHDVFHVSLLRKCMETPPFVEVSWPEQFSGGQPLLQPDKVVDRPVVLRDSKAMDQGLILWRGQSPKQATWEDLDQLKLDYPQFHLEDEIVLDGGGNDAIQGEFPKYGKGARAKRDSTRYAGQYYEK